MKFQAKSSPFAANFSFISDAIIKSKSLKGLDITNQGVGFELLNKLVSSHDFVEFYFDGSLFGTMENFAAFVDLVVNSNIRVSIWPIKDCRELLTKVTSKNGLETFHTADDLKNKFEKKYGNSSENAIQVRRKNISAKPYQTRRLTAISSSAAISVQPPRMVLDQSRVIFESLGKREQQVDIFLKEIFAVESTSLLPDILFDTYQSLRADLSFQNL